MAGRDFLEEQRRRQRDLVAARAARQNPDAAPAPVIAEKPPMTLGDKIKNFWFYYKYFLLVGAFLAIMLGIAVAQCAGREDYDAEIILYTYHTYTPNQIEAIEVELEKYGEDINGDGEVNYQVLDCSYAEKGTLYDQISAKETKLTVNVTSNDKALLYITDAKSHKKLVDSNRNNGIEFFVDLSLPADNGTSVMLSQEFYFNVNAKVNEDLGIEDEALKLNLPEGLRISRRITGKGFTVKPSAAQVDAAEHTLDKIKNNVKNEAVK